jgi:hypothetical protein
MSLRLGKQRKTGALARMKRFRLTERERSGDDPVRHGFREDDVCELSERGFQDEKQGRGHDQSESAVSAVNQLSAARNRQEERKLEQVDPAKLTCP